MHPKIETMHQGPEIPQQLTERGGASLQWEALRDRVASNARSPLGRSWVLALEPSADRDWIAAQQTRNAELRLLVGAGAAFDFRGLFDPEDLTSKARIEGSALEPAELLQVLAHADRVHA